MFQKKETNDLKKDEMISHVRKRQTTWLKRFAKTLKTPGKIWLLLVSVLILLSQLPAGIHRMIPSLSAIVIILLSAALDIFKKDRGQTHKSVVSSEFSSQIFVGGVIGFALFTAFSLAVQPSSSFWDSLLNAALLSVSAATLIKKAFSAPQKEAALLLSVGIGEIFCSFFGLIWMNLFPLSGPQLLLLNLIFLPLLSVSISGDGGETVLPKRDFFKDEFGKKVLIRSVLIALLTLFGCRIGMSVTDVSSGLQKASALSFWVMMLSVVFLAFSLRFDDSILENDAPFSKGRDLPVLYAVLLPLAVLFIPPVADWFSMTLLPFYLYLLGTALCVVMILAEELLKSFGVPFGRK